VPERDGLLDLAELERIPGYPGKGVLLKKKVAVLECAQEIPCNPCEAACPRGAITVGTPITNLPAINADMCVGCGACIAKCPGLAIFVVDLTHPGYDYVTIPYEYLPLPDAGQEVGCLDRRGRQVSAGRVRQVLCHKGNDKTALLTVEVPKGLGMDVRNVRLPASVDVSAETGPAGASSCSSEGEEPVDVLVCRCEEVLRSGVVAAIREGAASLDAVKRRTRAGMGLCQGRNCSRIISRIIAEESGRPVSEVAPGSTRPPVRPVKLSALARRDDESEENPAEEPPSH
jgi:Fe-S-cluster-containing hydrogenase component 2/bacterioferritin-associated ferredoxin